MGRDDFLARHLRAGQTYPLLSDGPGGTITVAADPSLPLRARVEPRGPSFEDVEAACRPFPHATAELHRSPGENGRGWIAVAGAVRQSKPGRPLTRPEIRTVVRLARSPFEAASRMASENVSEESIERAFAASGEAAGFEKDVDGDGRSELVARVSFRAPRGEIAGAVLLVAQRSSDGSYTSLAEEARAGTYGQKGNVDLLGLADLDGDGALELVFLAEDGHEGTSIGIVGLAQGATFFRQVVAPRARCVPWPGEEEGEGGDAEALD